MRKKRKHIAWTFWIDFLLLFNWMSIAELVPPLNSLNSFVLSPIHWRKNPISFWFNSNGGSFVSPWKKIQNHYSVSRFFIRDRTKQLKKINGNWLYIIFHLIDSLHSRSRRRIFPLMLRASCFLSMLECCWRCLVLISFGCEA